MQKAPGPSAASFEQPLPLLDDHKEKVANLLSRVPRVSVETVAITQAMEALKR